MSDVSLLGLVLAQLLWSPLYMVSMISDWTCMHDTNDHAVSENAPRAIRGGLTGIYQLFITMGIMLAFWSEHVPYIRGLIDH